MLRDVVPADLPVFFAHQLDADANYMAAFTAKDPTDWNAFSAHWDRILADATVNMQTIVDAGRVVGYVSSYETDGTPEVTYWLGKDFWGQGIATRALAAFLAQRDTRRPMYARVAKDNVGSLRVLQKCRFRITGEDRGFANARGHEVEEYLLTLDAS